MERNKVNQSRKGHCEMDGCNSPIKARRLCEKHYIRLLRYGNPESFKRKHHVYDKCTVPGCQNKHQAKGLCVAHYATWKDCGQPVRTKVIRLCGIEGCERPHQAKGLCNSHYNVWINAISRAELEDPRKGG